VTDLTPSAEQQEILDRGLDTIRIRAGAGTGKTTTVAMVVANLVRNHGVEPERVLGITFTNKAAAELADRIKDFLGGSVDEGRQAEVHTYHGFAAQIMAEFGALAGVDTRVRVITPTFSRQILGEIYHHTTYQILDITSPSGIDKTRVLGDRLGDHLLNPADVAHAAPKNDEIWAGRIEMLGTLERYEEEKRRLGVVDYSDLVTKAEWLMRSYPELSTEVRGRYQAVVLDEYQDTNPAQRALLTAIFGNGMPVIGVGDEDQTIYEWRGASAENFELFPIHFKDATGADAASESLTLNRRSSDTILRVANLVRSQANPVAPALVSDDPGKPGTVITHWATDVVAEADWISRRFQALHDDGTPWREMAVLFRKNRDFAPIVDSMARHDIPVEVANLGGLLSVPEIGDLRAWLTIVDRPEDSAALIQILLGSRYRLGLADLAPLARWLASADGDTGIDAEDVPPLSLLEALEDLGSIPGLRPEATAALEHFLGVYREILARSQGMSLVETARLTLDRTRAWQDAESLPPNQRMTARLNLYRLLDLTEEWSPLKGRPSLQAFLDYLEAMEDEPAEELDSAHLSGEDAVTLVTVHRAKGLEWDVVALPVVTKGNFPSSSRQFPDPTRFPEYVPANLRIDHILDDMPGDLRERNDYFRERNDLQEWRVAYVATTRARSTLMVSGSYWQGMLEPAKTPREPSPLFTLVEEAPGTVVDGHEPEPPPRPTSLRIEPDGPDPDPLFADGWDGALRRSVDEADFARSVATEHGLVQEWEAASARMRETLFDLDSLQPVVGRGSEQKTVSVTGLVTYARCPKRYFWTEVDPLPRRRNRAAAAGTELHRRIELHQLGQVPFEEMSDELYDAVYDDAMADSRTGGFKVFLDSKYGKSSAALVEAPFSIDLGNEYRLRGRIDAIYVDDGKWEIVDFKSGHPSDDGSKVVQLEAYALAATGIDFGLEMPDELDVSFVYLGGGLTVETEHADRPWLDRAQKHLVEMTDSIGDAEFEAKPGPWCNHCDFLRFCSPGRAFLDRSD
jgi:ATP-dependent DNA helicase UvrD/PcrA